MRPETIQKVRRLYPDWSDAQVYEEVMRAHMVVAGELKSGPPKSKAEVASEAEMLEVRKAVSAMIYSEGPCTHAEIREKLRYPFRHISAALQYMHNRGQIDRRVDPVDNVFQFAPLGTFGEDPGPVRPSRKPVTTPQDVVHILSESGRAMKSAEVAEKLGRPGSTVRRIMLELERAGEIQARVINGLNHKEYWVES